MSSLIDGSLSVLLDVSCKAIVLAIVAATCLFCLRVRDSNIRHRVWSAVLLAMLMLPALAWVTPSLPLPEIIATPRTYFGGNSVSGDLNGVELAAVADGERIASSPSGPIESAVALENLPEAKIAHQKTKQKEATEGQTVAGKQQQSSTIAWAKWMFTVYAVGLTALLGRLCLAIWSARRLAKQARPIPSLGSGRYDIAESEAVRVPLTVGIIRPRVLLPADWSSWSAEMLASVLRHEQTHIDRKDPLVALLAEINRCVYWFHPLAWLLRKRLATLAEHSCDDSVIATTGDRTGYARHLVDVACRMSGVTARVAPLGVSMARTSQVESRVDAILDAGRPLAQRLGWRGMTVLAAIILPLVLLAASVRAVDENESTGVEQAVADTDEADDDEKSKEAPAMLKVPEGFWITYHVEAKFGGTTENSLLTIVLLDKTTQEERACRWIEAIQRYENDKKDTVVTRLLVPEEHLRLGVDVLEKALVVLQRIGDQPPIDYTNSDRSEIQSDFNLVMPIRRGESQPHGPELVELNVGNRKRELPLPGWTNRRIESVQAGGLGREIVTRRWVIETDNFPGVAQAQETIRRLDAEKTIVRTTSVSVTDAGMGKRSQFTDGPLPSFAITPGWEWALSPRDRNYATMATAGMVIRIDESEGSLKLTLAYPWGTPDGGHYIRYRPVAFDASRKRYEFKHNGVSASGDVGLGVFILSKDVPIDSIVDIGIERLAPDGFKVYAETKAKAARDAGLEPLPFPTVREPYNFRVTTTENETLGAEDLHGKVVLIDCWATWCGPCMAKMPKLKLLYKKWHSHGFEIVGVNFDNSTEVMQNAVDSNELPWPQVMVPKENRELWELASGITSLPHLLLLDRQGNLHADCSPDELEQLIEQLMSE